jgi:steroid delta-isomerase-like uncharacterized protein
MSTEENKALVRRFYDEVVSEHKLGVLDEIIGTAADGAKEGFKDDRRRTLIHIQAAYPDLREQVEQMIAEGDWVAVWTTVEGTHTGGDYVGIPATGKRIKIPVAATWRINNGKLVEQSFTADFNSVFEQLGVASPADLQREANKALVLGWIEARIAKDVETAVEAWAEELQDWFRNAFNSSVQGFPDARVTVDDLIAERDKVVMRGPHGATHLGTWQGVPPSGKKVEWQFVDTYTVKDGKLSAIVRVAPDLKALLLAPS